MTNEQVINELRMALNRLKENGHCDNNRAKAFDIAIRSLTNGDYWDGFRDGVADTTKRAKDSVQNKEDVLEDFYDYADNCTRDMEYMDFDGMTRCYGRGWLSCDLYGIIGEYLKEKKQE